MLTRRTGYNDLQINPVELRRIKSSRQVKLARIGTVFRTLAALTIRAAVAILWIAGPLTMLRGDEQHERCQPPKLTATLNCGYRRCPQTSRGDYYKTALPRVLTSLLRAGAASLDHIVVVRAGYLGAGGAEDGAVCSAVLLRAPLSAKEDQRSWKEP